MQEIILFLNLKNHKNPLKKSKLIHFSLAHFIFILYVELISTTWRTSCHFYRSGYSTCSRIQNQWLRSFYSVWLQWQGEFLYEAFCTDTIKSIHINVICLYCKKYFLLLLITDFYTLLSMPYTWCLNQPGRFVSSFIYQSLSTWQSCALFILFKQLSVELLFKLNVHGVEYILYTTERAFILLNKIQSI